MTVVAEDHEPLLHNDVNLIDIVGQMSTWPKLIPWTETRSTPEIGKFAPSRAEIIGASNVNVESSVPPCDNTFTVVLCAGPLPERNRHNICDVDVQDTLAQRLPPLFAV